MRKKFISVILILTLTVSVLSGCALFEHNNTKDMQQVVAVIDPITETRDGKSFSAPEKKIYKTELVSYINNNMSSQIQSGTNVETVVNNSLTALIQQELILRSADKRIAYGDIEWGLTEENQVQKLIYNSLDSEIKSLCNEILTAHDEEVETIDTSGNSSGTTYPIQPEEDADDEEDVKDTEAWVPDTTRYPGLYGDEKTKSLRTEAMRQLIQLLEDNVDNDFRVTAEKKKEFDADKEAIEKIINAEGYPYVYPYLGKSAMVQWIIGRNAEAQVKITLLQEYLNDDITISAEEIEAQYTSLMAGQTATYDTGTAYDDAMKDNKTTVLYHPAGKMNKYFYVKHILIPFSDGQKADLAAFKKRASVTKEQIRDFRDNTLAKSIVAYPHVNGEDDIDNRMTVDQVMQEVRAVMTQKKNNPYEAERAFNTLIYKYNTDTGIFGNDLGYAVAYKLDKGETETYMQEFADGARKLRDEGSVGSILNEYVVTDYGVHILYYAGTVTKQKVQLSDYQTAGQFKTYAEIIEETLRTAKEETRFDLFAAEEITAYEKSELIHKYEKRYKSLWEA